MNIIKSIPKSFQMHKRELPFFYDDKYLTNGCFAVSRENIKDSYRYCLSKDISQPDIKRIIPEISIEQAIRLDKTNRLLDTGFGYVRIFIDKDNNEYHFDDKYIKHFDIETLYTSEKNDVAFTDDKSFLLMPIRNT